MPDEKDFLDQFSNANKPASFQEEVRTPVVKQKKPLNVKALIIFIVIALLMAVLGYFLFFAPKIEMPDFVGKTKTDVAAWVKQQGIEATGVVFDDTYDFDVDEGQIISQNVNAGKKVKNNVKLNFVLSLGPDPDEKISVPNLDGMTKEDIQDWIATNKLLKTKISTSYNEEVAEGEVIDYSYTGCEADSFTRGCNLKVNVSKGPAPAGKVTVEDFEKKPYANVEAWAKSKKIELNKVEQYSEKIEKDYVISQSVASGKTMKEGDTLTVVVSKGKAVYMEDVVGWDKEKFTSWAAKNVVSYKAKERYSSKPKDVIISQSISPNVLLKEDDFLEVGVSLGNYVELGDWYNRPYHSVNGVTGLHEKKDEENDKGADISTNKTYEYNDTVPAGFVIRNDLAVEVGGTVNIVISKGKNVLLKDLTDPVLMWSDIYTYDEYQIRQLLEANEATFKVSYEKNDSVAVGHLIRISRGDGEELKAGVYLPQDVAVTVVISD